MSSIFNKNDNEIIIARINNLTPESKVQWGKMNVAQMLSHCQAPMDVAFGMLALQSNFFMQLLGKFFKNKIISSKEFKKNSPTAPAFIRKESCDFQKAKQELIEKITHFSTLGKNAIKNTQHPFFGKMTYDEWDTLQSMHLDHHLRQFGV
ncbi:DUF1569 domain-containing protein [Flavobacterium sp.]|uniref:DUF1569 domain-containing protein n=1 Tax=Flavobacterium sp. TaxID=239 RepID=UPI0025E8CAE2|nr:DUF1569 domain-containing protein [Flavobacterium sp.]